MDKPFIHLVKTINAHYVFDVNRNEVIEVDEDVYHALDGILRSSGNNIILPQIVTDKIENLKSARYLSSRTVDEVEHESTNILEYLLDRKVSKMTLQLTQNCNLRCTYCTYTELNNEKQRCHSEKRMTYETAIQALKFLMDHSIDNETINIGLYGGEPTLEFNLIKNIVEHIKKEYIGKKVSYSLTTNATILSDEMIEYFVNNNFYLTISIDGPKKINDIHRRFKATGKGTFDTIVETLIRIKKKYPEYFKTMSISMVIDPQNDYDDINSLFKDCPIFQSIMVHSTIVDDIYSLEKNIPSKSFVETRSYNIFLAFLKIFNIIDNLSARPIAEENITKILDSKSKRKSRIELPKKAAPGGPCIPGQLRLFVDIDGNYYPCERVSETSEVMRIGNLKTGFDLGKCRDILNIGALTAEKCKNCWVFASCNLCAKHADNGNELSGDLKCSHCNESIANAEYELLNAILFDEIKKYY